MQASPRRVVVTGMGMVTPLGQSIEAVWDALRQQRSGVGLLDSFPGESLVGPFAAQARQFRGEIGEFGPLDKQLQRTIRKGMKLMCREIQMGVAAAQLALSDAGLDASGRDPDRVGVSFGSDYMMTQPQEFAACAVQCLTDGRFEYARWGGEGLSKVDPLWLLKYLPNMPASHIAIYNDLRGPSNSVTVRECSSYIAIGEGFEAIARGAAEAMVVGATGTRIHPLRTLHTLMQEEIAEGDDPAALCRPFDLRRNGLVLGEGAGALVLESWEHAERRNAKPLAEVLGHASSAVVDRRGVAQLDVATANVVRASLRRAGLTPSEIGHVHAHGLGTQRSDRLEARGIRESFREAPTPPPVTAVKSYIGHMGAGCGAVEAIISILAMRHRWLPPVLNYLEPDPRCDILVARPGQQTAAGESFVSINFAPTGQAAAVVIRGFDGFERQAAV